MRGYVHSIVCPVLVIFVPRLTETQLSLVERHTGSFYGYGEAWNRVDSNWFSTGTLCSTARALDEE